MRYICILREVSFYLHAMAIAIACSFMSGHEASASDFSSDSSRVVFVKKSFFTEPLPTLTPNMPTTESALRR
mgnify:CR=1 FL=1